MKKISISDASHVSSIPRCCISKMGPPRFELGCQAPEAWRMGQATLRPLSSVTESTHINLCFVLGLFQEPCSNDQGSKGEGICRKRYNLIDEERVFVLVECKIAFIPTLLIERFKKLHEEKKMSLTTSSY